jgi:hypothetical protein
VSNVIHIAVDGGSGVVPTGAIEFCHDWPGRSNCGNGTAGV